MADGSRTRDRRDHNAELYQLSYSHLAGWNLALHDGAERRGRQPGLERKRSIRDTHRATRDDYLQRASRMAVMRP